MAYAVKEIFYTVQGEGGNAGRPAVFCRFSGCNLWSGREEDRGSAVCQFCDTDFIGIDASGGRFKGPDELAGAIRAHWPGSAERFRKPLVVCTGGEPALQLDALLVGALHAHGFEIAVETNGTVPLPPAIDWVCVSPKAGTQLTIHHGNELKLVFPQAGAEPERYVGLAFEQFFLQPMDGARGAENTRRVLEYCLANPPWRVSLQAHKLLGIR
jgi:7-carboxy-7-deazaguanine synthase (Cx14CxxC type)